MTDSSRTQHEAGPRRAAADQPETWPGSPLGRVLRSGDNARLEFRRDYPVPVDDLWAAVTESDRLARWIGTWTGRARVGATVQFQMRHEPEPCEPESVTITECAPPHRLAVVWQVPGEKPWHVELTIAAGPGGSSLVFVQRLSDGISVSDVGAGWHWYLDRLTAVLGGGTPPEWAPYPPALTEAYARLG